MKSKFGRSANAALPMFVAFGLLAALAFAVGAFGGVHGWATALVEIALWSLGAAYALAAHPAATFERHSVTARRTWLLATGILGLYVGLQLVPLPPSVLGIVTPQTAELYVTTVDAVITATPEDSGATVATEEEREPGSRAAALHPPRFLSWRPIALHPFTARQDVLRYLALALALWLTAWVPRPALVLGGIVAVASVVSAFSLVQFATWNGYIYWFFEPYQTGARPGFPRVTGPFVNPDHFAAFLAIAVPCGAGLLLWLVETARIPRREASTHMAVLPGTLLTIGLALMTAALLGSASRAGLVGVIVGLFVLWWGGSRRALKSADQGLGHPHRHPGLARFIPALIGLAVIAGAFLYAGPQIAATAGRRFSEGRAVEVGNRPLLWRQTLAMIGDFPLVGVGPAGWQDAFHRYQGYPIIGIREDHAHNDYLEWCAEVGILGVVLTVLAGAAYVRWARENRAVPALLRWAIAGGISALAWHELFDFPARIPAVALTLAILLGLLCNPNWRAKARGPEREVEVAPPRCPSPRRRIIAIALAACLSAVGVRQFSEFRLWSFARGGSLELPRAPGDPETWYTIGGNFERSGSPGAARAAFRAAVALRPADGRAYWQLARVEATPAARLRAIDAALYLNPTKAQWRAYRAMLFDQAGESERALADLEEAAVRSPRLTEHPYLRRIANHLDARVFKALERGFRRALEEFPGEPALLGELASFYALTGRWREAGQWWDRAVGESGDLRAADAYRQGGDLLAAEKLLRRTLEAHPGAFEPYRKLATEVYAPQGRYEEAIAVLEEALRRSSDPLAAQLAIYELHRSRGDEKAALAALEAAMKQRPGDGWLQAELGRAYLETGDFVRAKIALDRAIDLGRDAAGYHYLKGLALERMYDFHGARAAYRAAVSRDSRQNAYREALERIEGAIGEVASEKAND